MEKQLAHGYIQVRKAVRCMAVDDTMSMSESSGALAARRRHLRISSRSISPSPSASILQNSPCWVPYHSFVSYDVSFEQSTVNTTTLTNKCVCGLTFLNAKQVMDSNIGKPSQVRMAIRRRRDACLWNLCTNPFTSRHAYRHIWQGVRVAYTHQEGEVCQN